MRTHVLKLGFLSLLLLTFFGCKDCSECKKEKESLQNQLESINQTTTTEVQNDDESLIGNLKRYQVKGGFSTVTGTIDITIPVTDQNLEIVNEPFVDISSTDYNAILIRIDDLSSDDCTNEDPITNVLSKTYYVKDLKPSTQKELKKDGKLMVVVLNNDTTDLDSLIIGYKDSVKKLKSYKIESCLINNCKKGEVQPADFRPKEDGGDIIVGG